jgi:subtilisin-like proprotein convertase family protein
MNKSLSSPIAVASLLLVSGGAQADDVFHVDYPGIALTVPDASILGASDTRTVSTGLGPLLEVHVSVVLTGGYLGDLYAVLMHDGVSTVLLNRPGRRAADLLGYADSGLSVTFSDTAPPQDVHSYRLPLTGSHDTPLGGPLTGTWRPDGRTTDPDTVLDTDPRSSFFSDFMGHTPDGQWTLYLADFTPVGEATLESWSLDFVAVDVPEPAEITLGFGLGLLAWAIRRRRS